MRTRKTRTEQLESLSGEELYKRALNRALYILEHSDKTEAELRRKLKQGQYPDEIIDRVLAAVCEYHYVDDAAYAVNYVRYHASALSRRELSNKLMQRGISREHIEAAFDSYEEEKQENLALSAAADGDNTGEHDVVGDGLSTEESAAVNALRKKLGGKTSLDEVTKRKVIGFMHRKGFGRDAIFRAFDELEIGLDDDLFPN